MSNLYHMFPCPYCFSAAMYNPNNMYDANNMYSCSYWRNTPMYQSNYQNQMTGQYYPSASQAAGSIKLKDYGPEPFVVNIEKATLQNNNYRIALWTGCHLQLTLMSINVGEDIGLEVHPHLDQFIRIEQGQGLVRMGDRKDKLDFQEKVYDDYAVIIPAGKWHNLINTGNVPLKLYSIYAPPEHPRGTVHVTKEDA